MANSYRPQSESHGDYAEQIVSAVSHDLKNPTRQIKSFLQILESHAGDDLDEEGLSYLHLAMQAADNMYLKLQSLAFVSQATAGALLLEPCDAAAIIEDAVVEISSEIESSGAVVNSSVNAKLFADCSSLQSVFVELIRNSIRFCAPTASVHISGEPAGELYYFTVSDNGPGFEAKDYSTPFNLFRRFHLDDFEGSGAGLTVVRALLARHRSDVTIESSAAGGTTVRFAIALAETSPV